MQEQLVSIETAKLAKEKEFNIPCKYYFDVIKFKDKPVGFFDKLNANGLMGWSDKFSKLVSLGLISCPTQSLLQKWLREVHDIHIEILFFDNVLLFGYKITKMSCNLEYDEVVANIMKRTTKQGYTYEEALEIGLQEGLKLIKS